MKNNVKKEKDELSQFLLYSVFLSVNVYFRTKIMAIEAYAQYLQMVESLMSMRIGLERRGKIFVTGFSYGRWRSE